MMRVIIMKTIMMIKEMMKRTTVIMRMKMMMKRTTVIMRMKMMLKMKTMIEMLMSSIRMAIIFRNPKCQLSFILQPIDK